ncbi:BRO family protein [Avibacterium paragallinarum]|uniref:Bro-N domain-containing protein n=1 Tax=Avibacterium paragallinarum TaxID=728 RepID=A0AAE5TG75_AVIPA|nr:BRO family protein [Avibacterium paragallinarum]MEE3609376.1 BRO family protein [Avibacterium paragallinarum]MEE3621505.1 BRO family protein [Avibacterium paragallinarum]MEE3669355.1 BRO family protein [Avibacterium paragallinarum]MEE3681659.1 BRO family protein [Avibacterium paragallinarum]MEE4386661.1 BRO family protein [Avibacterium paragallinarum]
MTTLIFKNTTISAINQNNQVWLSISDIGKALGYSNPLKGIGNLYNAHQDEFTPNMTALIEMQTNGGMQKVRIFSLRGAHLIGMLSHTKVAKDFRKWVLDILDEEVKRQEQLHKLPTTENDTITPEEQRLIQNAVAATHQRTKMSYGEIWARVKNKFAVAKYEQIKRKDHRAVMIYIASMHPMQELPPNSIALDMENFYMLAKAMNYINHSVAAWECLEDLFSDLESHKNYKTAFNLGTASNRLAQALESFIAKHTPFLKNASIREEIENLIFNSPRTEPKPTKTVNYLR